MNDVPLLIDADDLKLRFEQGQISPQSVRFVDLSRDNVYAQVHLPYAVHLSPKTLLRQVDESLGLLPTADVLQQLMVQLQISPQHWVIAYDDEGGGWASRLLWTLHCVGFQRVSVINGGIHACLASYLALSNEILTLEPCSEIYQIDMRHVQQYRIEYDELLAKVQQSAIQLWDCRSAEEFSGEQRTARRAGHIPQAINLDWLKLFDKNHKFKLHNLLDIRQQLEQKGLDLTQSLVVYCQSHHRSSLAYLVACLLGCSVRAYDGAWSEWGNQSHSLIAVGH